MRATVRLGRVFGIEIGVHWSVLVIAGLISFGLTGGLADPVLWAVVVPTVAVFFVSLLAHELSHSVVARRNGMEVRGITLWLLGGVAQLDGNMPSAGAEFRIAAAGPAMSFLLGAGFFGLFALGSVLGAPDLIVQAIGWLAFVNVILGGFNLLPAAPLDGGRILAGTVWAITGDRTRAEVVATRAGQGFGGLLVVSGVLGPFVGIPFVSLWTALMGLFVYRAASAELAHARLLDVFGDASVRDVMSADPETVRGWMTVEGYAREVADTPPRHHVLPVVGWDGGIMGVVTLERLARVPAADRNGVRVQDVAFPMSMVATAAADENVLTVAPRFGAGPVPVLLVFDGGALIGIVTPADLRRATDVATLRPGRPEIPAA